MYTGSLDNLLGAVSIKSINLHAKALGYAGYIAAYVTKSVDTQLLAQQFNT